ncbi:MAG TPA: tetratricopeptide repeat protein [Blastocatellia bacterium]|nr:tetratricopeptide repeat protein [Blastocatellia bacterium]
MAILTVILLLAGLTVSAQSSSQSDKKSQDDKKQSSGQTGDKHQQAMMKFLEAQRLAQDGDPKAIDLFKEVIALDPTEAQPHVELGKIYFANRNFQEAEREAKEALKLDKDSTDSHRLLGDIYLTDAAVGNDKAKTEAAIKEFEAVTKADNHDDEGWVKLADLYQQVDKRDKAIEALKNFTNNNPENPGGFVELAQLYFKDQKYDEAAIAFRKAYDMIDPARRGRIAPLLAESLRLSGKTAEAADLLSKSMGDDKSSSPQQKLIFAEALLSAGKNDDAVKAADQVLKLDPKNIDALSIKAEAERRAGRRAEAAKILKDALQGQDVTESLPLVYRLAEIQEEMEQPQEAVKTYEESLGYLMNPDGTVVPAEKRRVGAVLTRIALVYRNTGDTAKEQATYARMRKVLGDKDTTADVMTIDALQSNGQHQEALAKAQESSKKFPDERSFKLLQAQELGELGRVDEGVQILKGMLTGNRDDAGIYQFISTVQLSGNKLTEAESSARQALKLDPDNVSLLVTLSSVLERVKKQKESEDTLRKALVIDPNNATVLNNLGYFITTRDDPKRLPEALDLIQKAVNLEPTNGSFLDSLGWVYFQMGKTDDAKKYLEQAVVYNHTSAEINEHVGDLYLKLGRKDDAKKYWEKALKLTKEPEQSERLKGKLK